MSYISKLLDSTLKIKKSRTRTNLVFGLISLLIFAQLIGLLSTRDIVQLYIPNPEILNIGVGITTIAIAVLLFSARDMVTREQACSEAIAEYMNDGLIMLDGSEVAYANPLARKLLRQELTTPSMALSPEIGRVFEQSNLSSAPVHYEAPIDGKHRHFLVSKINLDDDRQVYVFQDVTFLRESEEAKVSFIGTLSHEIKTPITSLSMALAMLERTGFDAELVRIANSDVTRLRVLLEDLLNVSKLKIVRDPNSIQKRETNLSALARQSIRTAMMVAKKKEVQLNLSVVPQLPVITDIDPTKISWVISTLLNDAIKHTDTGKQIDIALNNIGKETTFTVGFERGFEMLDPTGYGIVRDIIEAHSGKFRFQEKPGNSSVFEFSLDSHAKGEASNEAHLIS